jgi:hypothetical protein
MVRPPSAIWALREIPRLWRLVIACWVVPVLFFLPALWLVGGAVGGPLAHLPDGDTPPGDVSLIVLEGLTGLAGPLRLAVLSGCFSLWMWTVLWHAGLVGWRLWSGGRRVRLGEVLGLGMVAWWQYARLSATATAAAVVTLAGLWLPMTCALTACCEAMAEGWALLLIAGGVSVSGLVVPVFWAATARAAWLLGLPERRSVVLAWLRGVLDTVRTPLSSLGTVGVWAVPALVVSTLPLLAGLWFEPLRGGWTLSILGQIAGFVRALCWVGLFLSFAPVTGLANDDCQ